MRLATTISWMVGAPLLLLFCILYVAGFRVYRIPSGGMEPTIQRGELVIGRLSYSYRDRMNRFDLVIYRTPMAPGQIYAKRIAALPGEHVRIDASGMFVDRDKLRLPFPVSPVKGLPATDIKIPNDAIFVVGDNTGNSMDSRFVGPISKADVLGYLVFKK